MSDMAQHPVVRLKDGTVRGKAESGVLAFLGIPYAAPPFGVNRMQPPRPVRPWDGERDATAFGPTAPKPDYPPPFARLFPEVVIPGQECLNLNVWTPGTDAAGLPVLVWIHGGSFINGSGSVGEYNGAAFARDGVVCVTINYRLAAEGFLFLDDGIANLGLLDQLAALRWVQGNISAFGGDPARVTVAGESAGAMSVAALLSMPLAEGLFAQAIAQSCAAALMLTRDEGRMVAGYLAEALGVPADRDAIRAVPPEKLVQAASELVAELQTAPDPARWGRLALSLVPFAPTVDGSVLPVAPITAYRRGQGGGVPLLIGSNRDESRLFLVPPGIIDLIDGPALRPPPARTDCRRTMSPSTGPTGRTAAPATSWPPSSRTGSCASRPSGSPRPGPPPGPATRGCTGSITLHPRTTTGSGPATGRIPFVFDTITRDDVRPPRRRAVAGRRGPGPQVWVDFITHGDPGWAAYDTVTRTTGLLTDTSTPPTTRPPTSARAGTRSGSELIKSGGPLATVRPCR